MYRKDTSPIGHAQWLAPNSSVNADGWRNAARLDGVRHVDEDVADAETLGQQVAQASDAERLGRVVAGGEEVDPALARPVEVALRRLAGEERVAAGGDGLGQVALAGARDDGQAAHLRRAGEDRQ